jgi:carbamoyltransferase
MRKVFSAINVSTEHDGALAVINNCDILVYLNERFSRKKHSNLRVFDKRNHNNAKNILNIKSSFNEIIDKSKNDNHHLAHASSAYFSTSLDSAIILVCDGMGPYKDKYISTSYWLGEGNSLKMLWGNPEENLSYNSIGHLYSAITYYCGFEFWAEGKTMGLSALGKSTNLSKNLNKFVKFLPDGKYEIAKDLINFCFSLRYKDEKIFTDYYKNHKLYKKRFEKILGPYREVGGTISPEHMNLAFELQHITERLILHVVEHLHKRYKSDNICLSGGVFLNGLANAKIKKQFGYKNVAIKPFCIDDGQALGMALYNKYNNTDLKRCDIDSPYLGPAYISNDILKELNKHKEALEYSKATKEKLTKSAAQSIADGKIIGWYQGRSEIGPRALGNRSILADARDSKMKDIINNRIKHRENFRPFAPAVILEKANEYFDLESPSPYMLAVVNVKNKMRDLIPAVTHVDGTARVQTVTQGMNPLFYELINNFYGITGVPVVLNTSFNDNGEPILETPADAIRTFLNIDLDILFIGDYVVTKRKNDA